MTRHLSAEELAVAVDGALDDVKAGHLRTCAACRSLVADLSQMASELKAVDAAPEPPPAFWEELGDRVRASTAIEPSSARARATFARPLVALGTIAAVFVLLIVWTSFPRRPGAVRVSPSEVQRAADEPSWSVMAEMASALSSDDVRGVTASSMDAVATVNDLTANERETFVQLLKLEMGDVQ
jgi:hypothetical protein